MIEKYFDDLERHPIFFETDRSLLKKHLDNSNILLVHFSTDEIIYSSSACERKVGFLLEGKALVQTGASDHILLNTVGKGELFGIANLYAEDEPFPTEITAAQPSDVLFFKDHAFRDWLEYDPQATVNFLRFQSKKILYLNRKIMTFTAGSAEKKLASFILDHERDGIFSPPCSMIDLASMLGMGRASLYRAMDQLIAQGWIEKKDKSFIITDFNALAAFI